MKRLICILLCVAACFACSLTAFAGGPITANDPDIAENQAALAAAASLPSGLSFGVTYKIRSKASSTSNPFVLNVNGGADSNGTTVSMQSPDTDISVKKQKFWLISSDSYCKLGAVCSTSGKVLDAYRPLTDGCSVDIWNEDDDAQQLVINGDPSSGYTIRLASNAGLGLTAVSLSNGGAVQFKTFTNAPNQRWDFIDVSTDLNPSKRPNSDIQNKTEWCWATSIRVAVNHNYGKVSSRITTSPQRLDYTDGARSSYCGKNSSGDLTVDGVQRAIVIQVRGNDTNLYGRVDLGIDDIEPALEFADPDDADYIRVGDSGCELSQSNKARFKSIVQNGDYIVAGFGKGEGKSYFGHFVVITDYNSATGKYTLYDPWGGINKTVTGDDIFTNSTTLAGNDGCRLEYFFYVV